MKISNLDTRVNLPTIIGEINHQYRSRVDEYISKVRLLLDESINIDDNSQDISSYLRDVKSYSLESWDLYTSEMIKLIEETAVNQIASEACDFLIKWQELFSSLLPNSDLDSDSDSDINTQLSDLISQYSSLIAVNDIFTSFLLPIFEMFFNNLTTFVDTEILPKLNTLQKELISKYCKYLVDRESNYTFFSESIVQSLLVEFKEINKLIPSDSNERIILDLEKKLNPLISEDSNESESDKLSVEVIKKLSSADCIEFLLEKINFLQSLIPISNCGQHRFNKEKDYTTFLESNLGLSKVDSSGSHTDYGFQITDSKKVNLCMYSTSKIGQKTIT